LIARYAESRQTGSNAAKKPCKSAICFF